MHLSNTAYKQEKDDKDKLLQDTAHTYALRSFLTGKRQHFLGGSGHTQRKLIG